ncbi:hypothetical protein HN903_03945 [archaeon]|jgi:hypothetical protein|nr:hypothetical protein [archaeon]MBT7128882.1 hypothetical protein [archaeon]
MNSSINLSGASHCLDIPEDKTYTTGSYLDRIPGYNTDKPRSSPGAIVMTDDDLKHFPYQIQQTKLQNKVCRK